jgi:hypothetical protein
LAGHEPDIARDALCGSRLGPTFEPKPQGLMNGSPHGYAFSGRPFFERCRKVVGEINGGFHKSTVCRNKVYGKQ